MGLINANQLKDVLSSTSCNTKEYAKALKIAIQALEHPLVDYVEPPNSIVVNSGTSNLNPTNTSSQTIIALQCKSCGGIIDKGTMTCRHCGMTYMLVNRRE